LTRGNPKILDSLCGHNVSIDKIRKIARM